MCEHIVLQSVVCARVCEQVFFMPVHVGQVFEPVYVGQVFVPVSVSQVCDRVY